MLGPTKDLGLIGRVIWKFIGYKQTNRKAMYKYTKLLGRPSSF